jgi:hypothetical protein
LTLGAEFEGKGTFGLRLGSRIAGEDGQFATRAAEFEAAGLYGKLDRWWVLPNVDIGGVTDYCVLLRLDLRGKACEEEREEICDEAEMGSERGRWGGIGGACQDASKLG